MKSLFPDKPQKRRDSAIGGHTANDSLVQSEHSAIRSLGGQSASVGNISGDVHHLTAVPRGEAYEDVFTLSKRNQEYLTGKRDKPVSGLRAKTQGMAIFIIAGSIIMAGTRWLPQIFSRSTRQQTPPNTILILFVIVAVGMVGYLIYSWWRYYRFINNGQLLFGSVVASIGEWEGSEKNRKYTVTVYSEVTVPDGRTLAHDEKRTRGDLVNKPLPVRGTRVALLYVPKTERFYML